MTFNYGEKLKKLRQEKGLTQQQVADILNIKRSSYNQFEQQYDIIPIKRLNELANLYDVSIDFIFELTNKRNYTNNKKDINMELSSNRLKEMRKHFNLTQVRLAEKLNASPAIIIYHENKRTTLATPFLYSICSLYSISADYLLGKIDETSIY